MNEFAGFVYEDFAVSFVNADGASAIRNGVRASFANYKPVAGVEARVGVGVGKEIWATTSPGNTRGTSPVGTGGEPVAP